MAMEHTQVQALITRSETTFNSQAGRYLIDTATTRGPGYVPSKIEAAPQLAQRQAERTAPIAESMPPVPTRAAADLDIYEPAGFAVTAMVVGGPLVATALLIAGIAVRIWG
jgi:hypothetical protein